jgi:hypothetical protein
MFMCELSATRRSHLTDIIATNLKLETSHSLGRIGATDESVTVDNFVLRHVHSEAIVKFSQFTTT